MADITQSTINVTGISVAVTSDDKRVDIKTANATSAQAIVNDPSQPYAAGSITTGPLSICIPAELSEDFPGVQAMVDVEAPWNCVARAQGILTKKITINRVPGYPIQFPDQRFTILAKDIKGRVMLAAIIQETPSGDISFAGDVVQDETSYDTSTGTCIVTFTNFLLPDQVIIFQKHFVATGAPDQEYNIPHLVPYSSEREYHFVLKNKEPHLNDVPVSPGTLTIEVGTHTKRRLKVKDNGKGRLIGNVDPDGDNIVDYRTGEVRVTFQENLEHMAPIDTLYAVLQEVKMFPKECPKGQTVLKVTIAAEDVERMVKAARSVSTGMENGAKYRQYLTFSG